jgi:hypothetical protein
VARGATLLAGATDAEASTTKAEWLLVALVVLILLAMGLPAPT